MRPKIIISVFATVVVCGIIAVACHPYTHTRHAHNNRDINPQHIAVADRDPMMPSPFFMEYRTPGIGMRPMGGEPFGGKLKLTDNQRDKIKELDRNLNRDMQKLHDQKEELYEKYRDEVAALLTDEQFRKMEKMRNNLRKDMKKLHHKQQDIMEKHRRDFDSILTQEQKKVIRRKHHEMYKMPMEADAKKTGPRDDKDVK